MQIHSLTRFIAFPFILLAGFILYKSAMDYLFSDSYAWLILPIVVVLVALYIFSPNIDFWWHKRFPIKLEPNVRKWLSSYFPFYQNLSSEDIVKFENRLSLFMEGKEFILMQSEKLPMPEDMKAMIAANAIQMSLDQKDFLLDKYERIVAYPHPFPTPYYKHLHTVETESNDGVILLSAEHVANGMISNEHYNIALHGFIEAYIDANPKIEWPELTKDILPALHSISGLSIDHIKHTIGFDDVNPLVLALNIYHSYPQQFSKRLPELSGTFDLIFKK